MRRHTRRLCGFGAAACASLLLALPVASARVIDPDLQPVIDRLSPIDRVSVIVRFAGRTDLGRPKGETPELRRAGILRELRARSEASRSAVEEASEIPSW